MSELFGVHAIILLFSCLYYCLAIQTINQQGEGLDVFVYSTCMLALGATCAYDYGKPSILAIPVVFIIAIGIIWRRKKKNVRLKKGAKT